MHKNKFYVGGDFLEKVFKDFEYDWEGKTLVFKSTNKLKRLDRLPTIDSQEKLDKLLSCSNNNSARGSNTDIVLPQSLEKNKIYNTIQSQSNKSLETKKELSNHSETNTQVRGVNEADIIKTDGEYIYTLSNNNLYIVNINSKDFSISHTLKFDNYKPLEFYIKDNKLVTIGYYHDYTINKVDNISDKKNPFLIREVEIDGYYLSSRVIDDYFYLVSNKAIYYRAQNLRHYYNDSINNKKVLIDYKDIKYFPESMYDRYLITVGIDLKNHDSSNININAYLGSGNNMYVSNENMYITQNRYKYNIYDSREISRSDSTSNIYKFNVDKGKITYLTKGEVPGVILNQFSMDEYKGDFRIATTKDNSALNSETKNNIYNG